MKKTEKCQTFDLVCKGVCMPNDLSNIYQTCSGAQRISLTSFFLRLSANFYLKRASVFLVILYCALSLLDNMFLPLLTRPCLFLDQAPKISEGT